MSGHHHFHPFLLQAGAFVLSMLFPIGAIALALGARFERLRRHHGPPVR
jgi:hypothetical protein